MRLIKELIAAQLVVEELAETFAFRHALTRQAVYTDLMVRKRRALHLSIAEAMERIDVVSLDAHLADLVYHFYEAQAWDKVLAYARRAAEQAQSRYAPRTAVQTVHTRIGRGARIVCTPTSGTVPAAQQHFERALELAQAIGSSLGARTTSGFLASTYVAQHKLTTAQILLDVTLDADTPTQTIAQRMAWFARVELALARGEPGVALPIIEQLIASATNLERWGEGAIPRLWHLRGEALAAMGQAPEAEVALLAAQGVAHAQGARPLLWRILLSLGKLYRVSGAPRSGQSGI